jgi:hypothetical protein
MPLRHAVPIDLESSHAADGHVRKEADTLAEPNAHGRRWRSFLSGGFSFFGTFSFLDSLSAACWTAWRRCIDTCQIERIFQKSPPRCMLSYLLPTTPMHPILPLPPTCHDSTTRGSAQQLKSRSAERLWLQVTSSAAMTSAATTSGAAAADGRARHHQRGPGGSRCSSPTAPR